MRPEVRLEVAALELSQQARVLRDSRVQQMQRDGMLELHLRIRQRAIDRLVDLAVSSRAEMTLEDVAVSDDAAELAAGGRAVRLPHWPRVVVVSERAARSAFAASSRSLEPVVRVRSPIAEFCLE